MHILLLHLFSLYSLNLSDLGPIWSIFSLPYLCLLIHCSYSVVCWLLVMLMAPSPVPRPLAPHPLSSMPILNHLWLIFGILLLYAQIHLILPFGFILSGCCHCMYTIPVLCSHTLSTPPPSLPFPSLLFEWLDLFCMIWPWSYSFACHCFHSLQMVGHLTLRLDR